MKWTICCEIPELDVAVAEYCDLRSRALPAVNRVFNDFSDIHQIFIQF
jgi:hypothetical protein